jgi:hypothetical protein
VGTREKQATREKFNVPSFGQDNEFKLENFNTKKFRNERNHIDVTRYGCAQEF